jgi:hypothetical protein
MLLMSKILNINDLFEIIKIIKIKYGLLNLDNIQTEDKVFA